MMCSPINANEHSTGKQRRKDRQRERERDREREKERERMRKRKREGRREKEQEGERERESVSDWATDSKQAGMGRQKGKAQRQQRLLQHPSLPCTEQ